MPSELIGAAKRCINWKHPYLIDVNVQNTKSLDYIQCDCDFLIEDQTVIAAYNCHKNLQAERHDYMHQVYYVPIMPTATMHQVWHVPNSYCYPVSSTM